MTDLYRITVEITAPVYDTEVTSRVSDAITNLFPNADLEVQPGKIVGTAHSLSHFSELLHRQEILDTARGEFFENRAGQTFRFALKKGAAFEGRINFSVGQPDELGEIAVEVRVSEPTLEEYVDAVAPPTEDGTPIDPDSQ